MKEYILSNGKKVVIRKAEKKDAEELIKFINIISYESDFLTFEPGELKLTKELEESIIEECYNSDNKLFLIAEIEGEIVGNLSFKGSNRRRLKHAGEFGISVKKEYWNMGIASQLIKELIEWAKSSGIIKKINLKVREDNERAINLYRKFGFIEEGKISKEFYVNGKYYSTILMGLEI
ncbi:GNAT family N-acetyltransferase [Caloranaerobacter azorensis]|uniref:GNAT family N-acetyltransferase n=1 Tax=Caloranaerobacter azorensis TaxID=116090 RepID=A0A6P1YC17_9FIRM|nr:GNAT family N-acetyltransferase [Caloranaerobacter azorensis]QIB26900.1 GNAT family N-acetyltransferase [Caloranaerobacter azorensis]